MPSVSLVHRHSHVSLALLSVIVLGWTLLIWIVMDMSNPLAQLMMPMSADWSLPTFLAVFWMWSIMMAAMMLPSAAPMVLMFAQLSRKGGDQLAPYVFTGAYLAVWAAFSLCAAGLQWLLQATGLISPAMVSASPTLTSVLLMTAGGFQLSPVKNACLSRCRSPFSFLMMEWHKGLNGAFVVGVRHGLYCVGCCWALMLLLFVGGVMNLAIVALVAIGIGLEKLAPGGIWIARGLGGILLAAGLWMLAT